MLKQKKEKDIVGSSDANEEESMRHYLIKGVWKVIGHLEKSRTKTWPVEILLEKKNDVIYGQDSPAQRMDILRPKAGKELPLIVYFHGGGWVHGSKEYRENYVENLAAKGFLVANANYRLAPEYTYPAQVEDGIAVLDFLKKEALAYGWDGKHVFLCGDSAGANLAALLALSEKCPMPISALGLICGIYDYESFVHNTSTPFARQHMVALFNQKDYKSLTHYQPAGVTENIPENFPPCYLLSSEQDIVCKETKKLAEVLKGKGVSYLCNILPKSEKMRHVDQLRLSTPLSRKLLEEMTDFFKKQIHISND